MKAVIFDMDGVLVDSENLWQKAEKEVFSSLGVEVNSELSKLTKTMTTNEVTKFWFEKNPWQGKNFHEVEQMVISRVIELIEKENCEILGTKKFIEKLKSLGIKIGLATNSPHRIIDPVLKKTSLTHLFDTISSAEFEENGKPTPDIYLTTSRKLGIEPKNCVAIEDSHSGIAAAKKAGMTVVAFTNNNKNGVINTADYIIDDFENENLTIFKKYTTNSQA